MPSYQRDLAISAVSYDTKLVAELTTILSERLSSAPCWSGNAMDALDEASALNVDVSRFALVLHRRQWTSDARTRLDDAALRERVKRRPTSVCVVLLDASAPPDWLTRVPQLSLSEAGVEGVAEFVLDAVTGAGGVLRDLPEASLDDEPAVRNWLDGPPRFLAQPRAASALRREFDALGAELSARLPDIKARRSEPDVELHSLPHRLILRTGETGLSFSWINAGSGTVADGRLLVILWRGVAAQSRGIAALKSATPVREGSYHAEGTNPETWQWRSDDANGQAWSTANLAAMWLADVTGELAASGVAQATV